MAVNGSLILLRHGESEWNAQDRFTGWTDVPLSATGRRQAQQAGELLKGRVPPAAIHTSELQRALDTVTVLVAAADWCSIPVHCSSQLNERDYGELEGWRRSEARRVLGPKRYNEMHRGWDTPPPAELPANSDVAQARTFHPRLKARLDAPGETLADVSRRALMYWSTALKPQIRQGASVMVVGHSNSVRAIVRYLQQVPTDALGHINVDVGQPIFFDANKRGDLTLGSAAPDGSRKVLRSTAV